MNKVYTLLLVLLAALFGGNVYGQTLLLSEDFTGLTTGSNLAGQSSWTKGGSGPDVTVQNTTPLTYPCYNGGGGNYVQMPTPSGTSSRVYKGFTPTTAVSNTFYVSFLLRLSATTVSGDYFITLGDPTTGSAYGPRLFAKNSGAGFVLGVSKSSNTANYGSSVLSFNTTYLIVMRFSGVTGTLNDLAYVWVNPNLTSEPSTGSAECSDVLGTDAGYSGGNIGNFHWHNRSLNNPTGAFDGVRVAVASTSASAWTTLAAYAPKTVTFTANGGTGSDYTQTACAPTNLISNTFTRAGFTFAGWNTAADGSGTAYADGASYSFAANATLYAVWTASGHTITVTQATGGTISPGTITVTPGNNQSFTATPIACYDFTNWIVDGSAAGNSNPYTFLSVSAPHTITANYTVKEFGITASAGVNGNISPSGTTNVSCGGNQTYTIIPNSCYAIADVLIDGVSVGPVSTYTFTNVTAVHTISAVFGVSSTYNITASAGANGSISPAGSTSVGCGNNQTYTITPNSCYDIADVIVDGVSQGAISSYTFTGVTSVHTISASFVLKTHAITATAAANGIISPNGTTNINCGSNQTYTIIPNSCYSIADVVVDGISQGAISSYTFSNVTAPHTISATFVINSPNNIVASAGPNGSISPSGTTSVSCGGSQTYTITPNSGYVIADVLVDGVSNSGAVGAGSYTFSNVTVAHTISASFVLVPSGLGTYTFTGTTCTNYTPSGVAANLTLTDISPTGITCNTNIATNIFGGNSSWGAAFSSGKYLEFTATPDVNYLLTATSLVFDVWRSSAGAQTYVVRSSADGYASDLQTGSVTTSSSTKTVTLGSSFQNLSSAITFRIYGYGGSGSGDYRLDNITLNGYVIPACTKPVTPSGTFTLGTPVCGSTDITYTGTIPGGETYYWQTTTTGISTTYPVTSGAAFSAPSGGIWYIRSKVLTCWSDALASPSITVTQAVSISTQPANISVVAGNTASFSVTASNVSGYQWQVNTGSGWNNIIGETNDTYTMAATTSAMNGYQYRCVITGMSPCSSVNSNVATLTVTNPVVNTISNQSNVYGSTISLTVTATAAVSSWSATLPAGLSINSSGVITGTLTEDVINSPFSCSVTANFTAGGSNTKNFTWTITPKTLTISGLTGNNKVYDGNTTATLSGTASLVGIVGSDNVTLSGTPASTFNNKNVGAGKPITVTGYTLTGTKAGNYTLTQPTGITANITAKSLTVTGAVAQDKTYDGTTAATITGATPVGVISPDVVTIGGGGTFASANAGTGITVTASLTLGGADAGNYTLTQPTGLSANINKANPVFTTSAINVSVGGTYALPGTSISSTSGGAFSYSISGGGNATLSGTTITGVVVGTETLTVTQASTTNYNAGSITVTVNVSTITYQHGDFRTKSAGKWSYNTTPPSDITQWQKYNSSINDWEDFVGQPNTSPSYTAYITKNTEIPTDATAHGRAKIIVMRDPITNIAPTLTFKPSANWTFKNVVVKEGATIEMQTKGFNIDALGNFEIEDNGNFIFNYSSNGNPASGLPLWDGNEIFHPESNFYIYNHTANSGEYFLPPSTDITSNIYSGVEGYFGNLIIQSTDGNGFKLTTSNLSSTTKYLTHKDLIINTVSAYTLLYGNGTWIIGRDLKIGSTATTALTLTTGANTITLNVKRNLVKESNNIFRLLNNTSGNVSINVDGDVQLNSGTIDVNFNASGVGLLNTKGSLTVESGASLTASSATTTTTPSAVVKFSGANIQNVSGAGTVNIYHMVTDKTDGYVNLQRDLQTKRTLTMTAGNIQTNANLFELGESTSNTGTLSYTSGFVLGNMKRWFNGTSAGTDTKDLFPLGFYETGFGSDGLKNRFAKVRFTGGSPSGALTAFFVGSPMGNNDIPILVGSANSAPDVTFDITSTEDQGYWDISVSSGTFTSAETYTMTLLGEGFKTINNTTDLVLLKRPNIPTAWFVPGTSGFGALNSSYGSSIPSVVRNGVSTFSHYGFGGGDPNPLPVELTSFTASCKDDNVVEVRWTTASEFNSSYFILERSLDAARFETVAYVPAAVNSNTVRNYSVLDTATVSNSNYYRLTEVDQDGKRTMYSLVYVRCREVNGWNAYHTPDGIVVEATTNSTKDIQIRLYEVSGKLLMQEKQVAQRGYNRYNMQMPALAKGVYIIQLLSGDDMESVKVWVP